MKSSRGIGLLAVLIALAAVFSVPTTAHATWFSGRPMYRLYNQWTGEHFYTMVRNERDSLTENGWTYEGIGWFALAEVDAQYFGGEPVYRLYNSYVLGGDHHYTKSVRERDVLVSVGWTYEGVGWYSSASETNPVFRQYNPYASTGTHNYTTDKVENDELARVGWKEEGVAWYAVAEGLIALGTNPPAEVEKARESLGIADDPKVLYSTYQTTYEDMVDTHYTFYDDSMNVIGTALVTSSGNVIAGS